MAQEPEMIKCPGCDVMLPENEPWAQKKHMEERHPEIIADRMVNAGFRQEDGKWVDTLSSDD